MDYGFLIFCAWCLAGLIPNFVVDYWDWQNGNSINLATFIFEGAGAGIGGPIYGLYRCLNEISIPGKR